MNQILKTFFTASECATELGVTDGRIRQLCRALGCGTKMGRDWLLTLADIEELRQQMKKEKNRRGRLDENYRWR